MSEHVHEGDDLSEAEQSQAEPSEPRQSDQSEPDRTEPDQTGVDAGTPAAPETGDLVIDAALRDLAEAPENDLDAQVERGEQVQRTLQGRLSDLGG